MRKMMVILGDRPAPDHCYTCPCCEFGPYDDDGDEGTVSAVIPKFYSIQHARDEGWRYTDSILMCPPEEQGVWVCPDCWKEATYELE